MEPKGLHVSADVIDICSNIVSFPNEATSDVNSYNLAGVVFTNASGKIRAMNATTRPMVANFVLPRLVGGVMRTDNMMVPLPTMVLVDIGTALDDFLNGTVSITSMAPQDASAAAVGGGGGLWQWVGFSIGTIAVSTAFTIMGGVRGSFFRRDNSYYFSIESVNGPRLQTAGIKIKGTDGGSMETTMEFKDPKDAKDAKDSGQSRGFGDGITPSRTPAPGGATVISVGSITLPDGLKIDPTVGGLDIQLLVERSGLDALLTPPSSAPSAAQSPTTAPPEADAA